MYCTMCGAQLPEKAAHCPNCGRVTPYYISLSGVTPSDMTVASPYAQPSQQPYPPPDSSSPPSAPLPRRRLSAGRIVFLVLLLLFVVGAGSVLSFRTIFPSIQPSSTPQAQQATANATATPQTQQATANPTATPQTQQATATPSTETPQDLYSQVIQSTPVLDAPLSTNDANNWDESVSTDGKLRCQFTGGAYHAIAQSQNTYTQCMAQATHFGDLAYQVQMTIAKGDFGGMVFRTDGSQTKYYSFFIDRSGNYTLKTSVDDTGTHDYVLHTGTSSVIKTDLNQANLLAVIARGSTIYLYINQQYITSASDSTYSAGQIGLFGGNTTTAPADVLFRHAQVWNV